MAVAEFTMKAGDNKPWLVGRIRERRNQVFDLDGVESILLYVQHIDTGNMVVDGEEMEIIDPDDAAVRYKWALNEMSYNGQYAATVKVFWDDASRQTIPTKGYVDILVEDDLPA